MTPCLSSDKKLLDACCPAVVGEGEGEGVEEQMNVEKRIRNIREKWDEDAGNRKHTRNRRRNGTMERNEVRAKDQDNERKRQRERG